MTEKSDVSVQLDDRIRLMSAVLAATDFPMKAQKLKPHGTHAHARATRKYVADCSTHLAVQATQQLLDDSTVPLEALYALVKLMEWPGLKIEALPPWAPNDYNIMLRDFYEIAELEDYWKQEKAVWDKCLNEAQRVFDDAQFIQFLKPFLGESNTELIFIPNISYPADREVAFQLGSNVVCIAPPPLAWGDSPPWPYDEPTMIPFSIRDAMYAFGRILLEGYFKTHAKEVDEAISKGELPIGDQFKAQYPTWKDQFEALFLSGVVAMYLEAHIDEMEYKSYMVMQKKARGMQMLPGTVSVLRRYLQEVGTGGKYNNLIEFLPHFARQLRVAKKIVTF